MANALSILKNVIREEGADGASKLSTSAQSKVKERPSVRAKAASREEVVVKDIEEVVQERVTEIHRNQPRVYENGYSLEIIAREYALVLENEMIAQNISSVSVDAFGVFHTLGMKFRNFLLITDKHTNKQFYVLRSIDRTQTLKDKLAAIGKAHKSPVISLNYIRDVRLNLPLNLTNEIGIAEAKRAELHCQCLTMTADEASKLKFSFLEKVSHYLDEDKHSLLIYYNLQNLNVSEDLNCSHP